LVRYEQEIVGKIFWRALYVRVTADDSDVVASRGVADTISYDIDTIN